MGKRKWGVACAKWGSEKQESCVHETGKRGKGKRQAKHRKAANGEAGSTRWSAMRCPIRGIFCVTGHDSAAFTAFTAAAACMARARGQSAARAVARREQAQCQLPLALRFDTAAATPRRQNCATTSSYASTLSQAPGGAHLRWRQLLTRPRHRSRWRSC